MASTGFEPVTSAIPVRCSSDMLRGIYEIIHISTAVVDESED